MVGSSMLLRKRNSVLSSPTPETLNFLAAVASLLSPMLARSSMFVLSASLQVPENFSCVFWFFCQVSLSFFSVSSGFSVIFPAAASRYISVPLGMFVICVAATMAGMPSCLARIAVWDCGPPSLVIRARIFLGSRVAVSAGARSMAVSMKGFSDCGIPGAFSFLSSATILLRTSSMSCTRCAMYPPSSFSMLVMVSVAFQMLRSALVLLLWICWVASFVSVGSAAIRAVASRISLACPVALFASCCSWCFVFVIALFKRCVSFSVVVLFANFSFVGGAVIGGAICIMVPIILPVVTPTPEIVFLVLFIMLIIIVGFFGIFWGFCGGFCFCCCFLFCLVGFVGGGVCWFERCLFLW